MTRYPSVLGILAAVATATTASAQAVSLGGAEVSYDYHITELLGDRATSGRLRASGELLFGAIIGQLDLVSADYGDGRPYDGYTSGTLHLGYAFSPEFAVGLSYTAEDFDGESYNVVAGSVVYSPPTLGIEGVYAVYTGDFDYEANFLQARANYALSNSFSVTGDVTFIDEASAAKKWQNFGLGGRYSFAQGVYIEASAHQLIGDVDASILGIEIGFDIGGGTTFGPRDWQGLMTIY